MDEGEKTASAFFNDYMVSFASQADVVCELWEPVLDSIQKFQAYINLNEDVRSRSHHIRGCVLNSSHVVRSLSGDIYVELCFFTEGFGRRVGRSALRFYLGAPREDGDAIGAIKDVPFDPRDREVLQEPIALKSINMAGINQRIGGWAAMQVFRKP